MNGQKQTSHRSHLLLLLTVGVIISNPGCELIGCHTPVGILERVGLAANSGSSKFHGDRKKPDVDRDNDCPQIEAPVDTDDAVDFLTSPFRIGGTFFLRIQLCF